MINIKIRVVATSIREGGAKQETEALWVCWGKGFWNAGDILILDLGDR